MAEKEKESNYVTRAGRICKRKLNNSISIGEKKRKKKMVLERENNEMERGKNSTQQASIDAEREILRREREELERLRIMLES